MIVPFKEWHYGWMKEAAEGAVPLPTGAAKTMEQMGSFTAVVDGCPIACGGLVQVWPGRLEAWAHMTRACGPYMCWLTREVSQHVRDAKGRIEFKVLKDFEIGHKWARLLGFEVETPLLKQYGPRGEDFVGYVRIN